MLYLLASHTTGPATNELIISNEIIGIWLGMAALCMIGFALYRLFAKRLSIMELS